MIGLAVGFGGCASLDWESNCKDDLERLVSAGLVDGLIINTMFLTCGCGQGLVLFGVYKYPSVNTTIQRSASIFDIDLWKNR